MWVHVTRSLVTCLKKFHILESPKNSSKYPRFLKNLPKYSSRAHRRLESWKWKGSSCRQLRNSTAKWKGIRRMPNLIFCCSTSKKLSTAQLSITKPVYSIFSKLSELLEDVKRSKYSLSIVWHNSTRFLCWRTIEARRVSGRGVVRMLNRWPKTRASNSVGLQSKKGEKLKIKLGHVFKVENYTFYRFLL